MLDFVVEINHNSIFKAMKRLLLFGLAAMFLGAPSIVLAQQTGQKQQMQQHMQQMQDMVQKMNTLMERTQAMNQDMNRRMQQVQNEQIKNQYQMMHRFNEQMQMTLGNMKNAADRCNVMMQDQAMMRDRDMERDMDRLRQHLQDMTGQAEEAVQTMERLTKRLHQQEQATGK
jgi:hypothetical protein